MTKQHHLFPTFQIEDYFISEFSDIRKIRWKSKCLIIAFIFLYTVDTFIHHSFIHSLRPISISSQLSAQWVEPPWGAEPRFELGPALQQASALPSEPHCTLTEPHCTLIIDVNFHLYQKQQKHFYKTTEPWSASSSPHNLQLTYSTGERRPGRPEAVHPVSSLLCLPQLTYITG